MRSALETPLSRRSYPAGQTSAFVMKALLKYLDATKGKAVSEQWLKSIHVLRDDLEDETRPMPLTTLHRALQRFAEAASREAIGEMWSHLIAPDNLGVWMRILRGTIVPADAFSRLDSSDSEYGRTTRWETIETRIGFWRGRVHIAHDPAMEEDGLLALARVAELASVPALFGYGRGEVSAKGVNTSTVSDVAQEFEVRWSVPTAMRTGPVGALVGFALAAIPFLSHPSFGAAGLAMGATCAGALAGMAVARERLRHTETSAQVSRVHALERSILLKENRELAAAGNLEGQIIAGQYRTGVRMGSGASGVIYEAARISDGMPVAIKLLRAAAAHDATASDRLRREAEALGLAWHPNVVEVIDHGHLADGTSYLVMERLRGETLATRLKGKLRLTSSELLPIATQVCDALVAVHAAGVVHRDLKPSNIYLAIDVDDPGAVERVKLLDFGIARVEWEETRITNMGAPLGTPGYMSPEQESGGEVDARSDIFALGAVLYECLVGEPPPPTPSGLWRSGAVTGSSGSADSGVHKAGKLIPPAWKAVIGRAMAPVPSDRFQDARAFAQALRGLRDEIVREATPGTSTSST
jgi:serine/threonine-protein kinase